MTQTITALFDTTTAAEAAQTKLVAAGIPQSAIRIVHGAQTASASGSTTATHEEGGFWGSLKDFFMPEEDRYAYSEGLSRGGTMLTVQAEQGHLETAYDILEENGSVDLDERETTWRKEGWSGYTGQSGATAATGAVRNPTTAEAAGGIPATASGTSTAGAGTAAYAAGARGTATDTAAHGDKEYIPVVEERLTVGKRVVDHGRVRVRSYAVETPVQEQVNLRRETVEIDRRTVDRAPTAADEALFENRTIDAVERREEAVVSKDTRVVGEVGIRKGADQHTETVTDKVRRTEVEIEDERGNVSRTGTTGGTTETTTGTVPRKTP